MAPGRRFGGEDSAARSRMLDLAEALMLEDGYAGLTSRRLAAKAGVKQPLVYYYFRTMDDLFLAVFRRLAQDGLKRLKDALVATEPIRALWSLYSDPSRTALMMEFLALANHRKVVRREIARYVERCRTLEVEGLNRLFAARGTNVQIPSLIVTVLLTSLARGLVQEDALGIAKGHGPTRAFVEACLRNFEDDGMALPPIATMIDAQKLPKRAAASKRKPKRSALKRRAAT
jgi:AcrR family transcriptional regulator